MRELHWRKLSKTLVYETDAQWSHWPMKTWWRGPTRGNGIPGDQLSRWPIDSTYHCWVMLSCKSNENVVQGYLVTLGMGEKKNGRARLHVIGFYKCFWLMSIWEHYQDYHGGGFCRFDPPMRELHWRKLSKTLVYENDAQWIHWAMKTWWRAPIKVMACQETNRVDNLSIWPPVAELCRV